MSKKIDFVVYYGKGTLFADQPTLPSRWSDNCSKSDPKPDQPPHPKRQIPIIKVFR